MAISELPVITKLRVYAFLQPALARPCLPLRLAGLTCERWAARETAALADLRHILRYRRCDFSHEGLTYFRTLKFISGKDDFHDADISLALVLVVEQ